ncbi:MAG: cytochrome c1 [Hydrotalea sp.]|nr:cytochrome c1 [Hydrotalea sp.]
MKKNKLFLLIALLSLVVGGVARPALAEEIKFETSHPERQSWSWTGPFGSYDKAAAQRGLQIYTQVCAGCHALSLVPYRELSKIGYSADEIKAFARSHQVDTIDEQGKPLKRTGLPSDYFPKPFATEGDARAANGGTLPPDLSLIIKARNHGRGNLFLNFFDAITIRGESSGADYVYAILIGYENPPEGMTMNPGMHFNKYFSGGQIAMPAPLADGAVSYSDGTANDLKHMAHDVVTFLAFVSEPNLEASRYMALKFFLVLAVIYYLVYRMKKNKWRDVGDH